MNSIVLQDETFQDTDTTCKPAIEFLKVVWRVGGIVWKPGPEVACLRSEDWPVRVKSCRRIRENRRGKSF